MEPSPPEKAFSMGIRPATCSTGDVCMALDYLEDPAVHGITTQVRDSCPAAAEGPLHPCLSAVHGGQAAGLPNRRWLRGASSTRKAVQPALPW